MPPKNDLAFHKEVKKALTHFHDPIYLGSCPLAAALLSDSSLPVKERGQAVQHLLRQAIEQIKPLDSLFDQEAAWRPYRLLRATYIEQLSQLAVIDQLSISSATFYREQKQALARVSAFLRECQAELHPPPVSPPSIPRVKCFIGRDAELAYYQCRLERDHLAIITGLPGAGKTSLGAELVTAWQARGQLVVWITFTPSQPADLPSFLESVGLSLAALGQDAYWRFLQAQHGREFSLSLASLSHYLLSLLQAGHYLLCLDNYQIANDNDALAALCAGIAQLARQGHLWLIVISRVTPRFAHDESLKPLIGLSRPDAHALLAAADLPILPPTLFDELYALSQGLPIILKLFAMWLHNRDWQALDSQHTQQEMASFVNNLLKKQDVRSYLLRQVYDSLSTPERHFLTCVSLLRISLVDTEQEPLVTLLQDEGVQDIEETWMALADKHIFTLLADENTVALHPLLREYFHQRLRQRPADWIRLHGAIGRYYEQHTDNLIEAIHHYLEAGQHKRAARLLADNVTCLINTGQARAVLPQLKLLEPHLFSMAIELQFKTLVAHEAVYHLLGQHEDQKATLDRLAAIAQAQGQNQWLAKTYTLQAHFYRGVGETAAALEAAQAACAAARRAGDKVAEIESLNQWGMALWRCSEYAAARNYLEQSLAMARALGDQSNITRSLNNLGIIYHWLKDYERAIKCHKETLVIHEANGDRRGEAWSLTNLGTICWDMTDYTAAVTYCQKAQVIYEILGDRQGEANVLNNLGVMWSELGDYAAAQACYEQALSIYRSLGNQPGEAAVLNNLGNACRERGDGAAARVHHEQSLFIYQVVGDRNGMAYALTSLGMDLINLGHLDEAEAAYDESLALRRQIGQAALEIEAVAGLGQIALARGQLQTARQYVQDCLAYLAAHGASGIEYPFKVYLVCVRVLEACGEHAQARAVLEQAHALLLEQASRFTDQARRRAFVESVSDRRQVAQKMGVTVQSPHQAAWTNRAAGEPRHDIPPENEAE